MKILGIDPGINETGYACIKLDDDVDLSKISESASLVDRGTVAPNLNQPLEEKLKNIHCKLKKLISTIKPDVVVVEDIYSHSVQPRTGLKMGQSKGVIELAVSQSGVKLVNLSATRIKKALIGYGNASKDQVCRMVEETFNLKGASNLHESDALACALAYIFINNRRTPIR